MKSFAAVLVAAIAMGADAFVPTSARRAGRAPVVMEAKTGVERNPNFAKLQAGYLFPEIGRRRRVFAEENPELAERIISLGIGDTTQPIPKHILDGLATGVQKLGKAEVSANDKTTDTRTETNCCCYIDGRCYAPIDGASCDAAWWRCRRGFGEARVARLKVTTTTRHRRRRDHMPLLVGGVLGGRVGGFGRLTLATARSRAWVRFARRSRPSSTAAASRPTRYY